MEEKELLSKISVLEQRLSLFEKDPAKRGYFALCRIVNQQVDFLNQFNIKTKIAESAKEDATYGRTKDMWENLPKMISALSDLKGQLKIKGEDDDEDRPIHQRTTPESIADVLGDNKQQFA
jgi:hypothetical protein